MSAAAEPMTPTRLARRLPRWRYVSIFTLLPLGAATVLAAGNAGIPVLPLLGIGALCCGAAIVLLRPVLPPLWGPILFYDLLGTARRGRYVIVRCVYVVALLAMLFLLYAKWFGKGQGILGIFTAETIDRNQVSAFNDSFFQMFMAVQFLVILLLTPGITAGAVAEEKDRKTLEYLLATDLGNHEIILGKLVSRLAYMGLVLLTGLPVLSLLQLLGGVDPNLMLAGFVATAMTMLSLAALSILNSVYATKPRTAIALTYVQVAAYLALTTASLWVWDPIPRPKWLHAVCAGNAYVAVQELDAWAMVSNIKPIALGGAPLVSGSGTFSPMLLPIVGHYVAFHLLLTLLCLIGSLVGLRLWARWQASGRSRKAYVIGFTQRRLPRVSGRPMLWKELHTEPLFRLGEAAQIIITTSVTIGLIFCAFVLISVVAVGLMLGNIEPSMNATVRVMGTTLAMLMVLGTAVRSAGAISGERDRQTMDTLLTTPIANDTIVWSKWWGSVLGVRKAGYCLLLLWLVGVGTGGLSPLAVPLLLLALFAYLAFAASLGLWFSLRCRTTLRATIWTLVTLLGVSLGHWLLTFCCGPLLPFSQPGPVRGRPFSDSTPRLLRVLSAAQAYSLTPPVTMNALAFSNRQMTRSVSGGHGFDPEDDDDDPRSPNTLMRVALGLSGVALYGLAAIVLLLLTRAHFTVVTGRLPLPGAVPGRAPRRKRKVERR
ncbi:MAG TPA: ABC transporter permease subunit [Gemmataceae bacterium]|nr:ABC transporter permease subunit [Gemmataceae bacterium]